MIAQEAEKILPEVVRTGSDGYKTVAYNEIVPVLIEAVQEQQAMIDRNTEALDAQQAELDELPREARQLLQKLL